MEQDNNKIYSISEFVAFLNVGLKSTKAKIVGEVCEAKAGPTGHMYFTLKDPSASSGQASALMNCIMWASKYRLFGITLEPGKKIVASGNPEVYAPSGRLSFIADTIELAGEGDLKKQYDELKKKLEKEGVFALENKRQLPKYPQKIGVITSKQGAVIHDFLNNIGKFGFDIKMIDSRVEGQGAVEDLLNSIKTFRKKDIDVLVIIRGGGSMESLMPFNNELLVREIAGFPVPVIAGIGHDKDVPLVAMAADVMVSTPTAAANLICESWNQALLFLERFERNILSDYERALNNAGKLIAVSIEKVISAGNSIAEKYRKAENQLALSFQKFKNNLENIEREFDVFLNKCFLSLKLFLSKVNDSLKHAEKIVMLNNPERQLNLGYSIVYSSDRIVRSINDAKIGDKIDTKLKDGIINSEIKNLTSKND